MLVLPMISYNLHHDVVQVHDIDFTGVKLIVFVENPRVQPNLNELFPEEFLVTKAHGIIDFVENIRTFHRFKESCQWLFRRATSQIQPNKLNQLKQTFYKQLVGGRLLFLKYQAMSNPPITKPA